MLARKSLAPWEKARGSRVVVKSLQAAPVEFLDEDAPEEPERPPAQRAPGRRPGDRLRRIAAYSSAASTRVKQDGRKNPPILLAEQNLPKAPWSLKELLDALADELDLSGSARKSFGPN